MEIGISLTKLIAGLVTNVMEINHNAIKWVWNVN